MKKSFNIAIVGPESTGKSALAITLSKALNAEVVYEYAREYLGENSSAYTYQDTIVMAQIQWEKEQFLLDNSSHQFRIFDTNLDVFRIWQEIVFGTCSIDIIKKISTQRYDLYLLCYPDLPWAEDPLRELPDIKDRMNLFHMYKEIVIDSKIPFFLVKGIGEDRVRDTIEFIKASTAL